MTASLPLRVALASVAVLLAACGDDSPDRADTSPTTAPAAQESGTAAVDIVGFQFEPGDLTVARGTTVTFTNSDDFEHSAVADDDSFDTGAIAGGASADVTFDEAGEFPYLCGIHNYMKGMIVVE